MATQDFSIDQDNTAMFDMVINADTQDFGKVEGLETAINYQLFVDQRAGRDDIQIPRNRQGWIGDLLTKEENYQAGSFVYLKNQARDTVEDNNEVAAYAENALQYFVAIGAAKQVTADVVGKNIEGSIIIRADEVNRYSKLWRDTVTDAT